MNHRRFLKPFLLPFLGIALLTGCQQQQGELNSLKAKVEQLTAENQEKADELQQLNVKLSALQQATRSQESRRSEFEPKSVRAAESERVVVQYIKELSESVNSYTAAVADYRKKYLKP